MNVWSWICLLVPSFALFGEYISTIISNEISGDAILRGSEVIGYEKASFKPVGFAATPNACWSSFKTEFFSEVFPFRYLF